MGMTEDLLEKIQEYCRVAGIQPTTLGSMAVKDSRFVARLKKGAVTMKTCNKVAEWMAQNPPGKAA